MDPHHYAQQWRSRPIEGTICPTCSISHSPFCPSSFNQNPNFPFHPEQSFGFDPYHRPISMPPPFMGNNPHDGFRDHRQWHRNPNLDRDSSYGQVAFPPPPYDYGGVLVEGDRNYKRQRIDFDQNNARISSEDERRLKLIRDHGILQGGSPEVMGFNREMNRFGHESSVLEGSYGKNELGPGATRNSEMNHFHDPEKQYMQNSRNVRQNEEFSQSRYCHVESSSNSQLMPYPDPEVAKNNYHTQRDQSHYITTDNRQTFSEMGGPLQRNRTVMDNLDPPGSFGMQPRAHLGHEIPPSGQLSDGRNFPPQGHHNFPGVAQHGSASFNDHGGYFRHPSDSEASRLFNEQPPLPASPPPPLPRDLQLHSSTKASSFLFPVGINSSVIPASSHHSIPEALSLTKPHYHNKSLSHASGFHMETRRHINESQDVGQPFPKQFAVEGQSFQVKRLSSEKRKIIDASHLFRPPHRATRPDHFVVILRGLPGSGKSYLAKMLRDLEVESGGDAPRIHSMDDYFMTEVEKVEEIDVSKSSTSVKGKKQAMKKVMEYCYEPEMVEAYRSSMLKAFKKTLEEGVFTFVIVDDRNLRVADFAQFWATAKSLGYEVYILEAAYKDPAGCAARNVHGFTFEDIQKMAGQWEEAPSLYLQLNIKSLIHGDDLKESEIREVDMDTGDGDVDEGLSTLQENKPEDRLPLGKDDAPEDDGKRWNEETEHPTEEVKELGRSKWSDDLDEDDGERTEGLKGKSNALSGLIRTYAKEGKSVRWSDQVRNTGFSIGAARKANTSLVIGPGAGYNQKSNPFSEEESVTSSHGGSKSEGIFQERLRAERESFKAVFDRRRQKIGVDWDEEQ